MTSFDTISFMLGLAMISKIVKPNSRGFLFVLYSIVGSIGVIFGSSFGGWLYDKISHLAPYYLLAVCLIILQIFNGILGLMGKINV